MSEANGKVCCNCRHCIRVRDEQSRFLYNECEIDKHRIRYINTFEGWCRRWAKEKQKREV